MQNTLRPEIIRGVHLLSLIFKSIYKFDAQLFVGNASRSHLCKNAFAQIKCPHFVLNYIKRSSPSSSAEAASERLGSSRSGTSHLRDFHFIKFRPADIPVWLTASCRDQLDGWTYHLQMYKPRPAPVYYDSWGNIFKKSPMSFAKEIKGGKIWSVDTDEIGPLYITFDKKTIYNLFGDYPDNMTPEQVTLVNEEMPYWAEFFEVRT